MKSTTKRKIWDIISWIFVIFIFLIASLGLFLRIRRNQVYFFGNRYDAVLSKSMATTNEVIREEYKEKGWTNQFKKGALLVSTKIDEDTELKAGDIVLFVNPDSNKITAHRIVNVKFNGNEDVYTIRADAAKPGEEDGQRAFQKFELQAKVKRSIPVMGYVAGYITSFWGITAEIGVITIYIVYQFIITKKEEKAKSAQINESDQSLPLPLNEEVNPSETIKTTTSNNQLIRDKSGRFVKQNKVNDIKEKPVLPKDEKGRFVKRS